MSSGDIQQPSSGIRGLLNKFKTDRGRLTARAEPESLIRRRGTDSSGHSTHSTTSLSSISSLRSVTGSKYGKKVGILGSGIAGKVELYHKKSTNEFFAVKTFHSRESYESKAEFKKRCYREYEIVQGFHNEHILRAYSFSSSLQDHKVVMEFAPYSLLKVVQICKPHEKEVLCFFRQVCEGVSFLHSNYVSHRDLKMENLVMDDAGIVKIIDFGTAFVFGPQREQAMGIVGTESLMSPEAYKSMRYDSEANDVWSLGILLFSMFNLRFPWKAAKESDPDFKSFLNGERNLNQEYPELIRHTVDEILILDPVSRVKMKNLMEEISQKIPHHINCLEKVHARTLRVCEKRFKVTL